MNKLRQKVIFPAAQYLDVPYPSVFTIEDLEKAPNQTVDWIPTKGIRNYQARNFMRDKMRVGDLVLYYHSNTKPPHIAGVSRICKESYPDITQFDKKSKYYDPKATEEVPRWFLVDMEPITKFDEMVTLDQLKDNDALEGMLVIKRGQRLSVQPVEKKHFDEVCNMANAKL